MQNSQIIGIIWMISHCFTFAIINALVRSISDQVPVLQMTFIHALVAFILVSAFLLSKKINIKTQKLNLHLIRGFLGAVSISIYFYTLSFVPFTQAQAITLACPLMTTILAFFFLKDKIRQHRAIGLFAGLIGSLIIVKPASADFDPTVLLVLVPTFIWAVISIIIKILGKTEHTLVQLFYLTGFMSLFSLPVALYFWVDIPNTQVLLTLIAMGLLFVANSAAVFLAFKHADISTIMPFTFSVMVFSAIIAYFAFDEIMDVYTAIGSVVIVASVSYVARREAVLKKNSMQINIEI